MKKTLLIVMVLLSMTACVTQKVKIKEGPPPPLKIKVFLDKFFKEHPDCIDNEIKKADATAVLAMSFMLEELGDSIPCISELPMEFVKMYQDHKGKYVVKFRFCDFSLGSSEENRISDKYSVSFSLFSIVDKEYAALLKEGDKYRIYGSCYSYASSKSFTLSNGYYINNIYAPAIVTNQNPEFHLGSLLINNIQYSLFK